MKLICSLILFLIPFAVHTQELNVKVVRSGSMSDVPTLSAEGERLAQFEFKQLSKNMKLEISLWDNLHDSGSMSQKILAQAILYTEKKSRMDILIDRNGKQIDIKCIFPGEYIVLTPVKSNNGHTIQSFSFQSKPNIEGTTVPIILFLDGEKEIPQTLIEHILSIQQMESVTKEIRDEWGEKLGRVCILTYHLSEVP
jgi:hypothetical protein